MNKKKAVNKKYIITMIRSGYGHCDIKIVASD